MKEFIASDGLEPLASLIDSDNLYLRGQVLEIILCVTDCDTYDWFKPASSYSDKTLHQKLIVLARSQVFFQKLLSNRTGSYPGGSFRALQLIAFTLSWIRALYTADQRLQISPVALEIFRLWAQPKPRSKGEATKEGKEEDPEVQLAKALLDDFAGQDNLSTQTPLIATTATESAPPLSAANIGGVTSMLVSEIDDSSLTNMTITAGDTVPATSGADPLPASQFSPSQAPVSDKNSSSSSSAAQAATSATNNTSTSSSIPVVSPSVSTKEEMEVEDGNDVNAVKAQGNELFKQLQYAAAIERYQQALHLLADVSTAEGAELTASLYCNIATSWWKVAQDLLSEQPALELDAPSASSHSLDASASNIENGELSTAANISCKQVQFLSALVSCKEACMQQCTICPVKQC